MVPIEMSLGQLLEIAREAAHELAAPLDLSQTRRLNFLRRLARQTSSVGRFQVPDKCYATSLLVYVNREIGFRVGGLPMLHETGGGLPSLKIPGIASVVRH